MSVPYVCCTKKFENHYAGQSGAGLSHYRGVPFQKGYGLGGFFRKLFRSALPFIAKGAKTVGKEALKTGSLIANDVLSGETLKTAVKQRSKEAGKNLAHKAVQKVQSMLGSGTYKKGRKRKQRVICTKVKKRRRRDIFDS